MALCRPALRAVTICAMDVTHPLPLLGGLSAAQFMRRHWQKKPLLVRQAWPAVQPPVRRKALFDLAGTDGVESRLLERFEGDWQLRHGPFKRRALPSISKPNWTLLVQGLDLHCQAAHDMLSRFDFIPAARLDDLMVSYASDGGGVGPHLDAYDVFLLQVQGQRRWHIGPVADRSLLPDVPVRMLAHFKPAQTHVLAAGDMLYLPPGWGHDGIAQGECMTCSIGFRAATATTLAQELLHRLADDLLPPQRGDPLYRDPGQPATATPGRLPDSLRLFAGRALQKALRDPDAIGQALGQLISEPKPQVWFEPGCASAAGCGVVLDRRSRMVYDDRHVFINGEAFVARGRDARLMHRLADTRQLGASDRARLGPEAQQLLADWVDAGWAQAAPVST